MAGMALGSRRRRSCSGNPCPISNVQSLSLSPDGTKLVLILETPSTLDKKKLAEQGILYDGSFDATGQSIIDRLLATPGGESETWIQDLESGNAHKATSEEQRELEVSLPTQSTTPHGELSSQVFTKKEIEEQKIYSFDISPDRKKVAYWRMADDPSKSEWTTYPLLVKPADGGAPITITSGLLILASIGGVRTARKSTTPRTMIVIPTIRAKRKSWRRQRMAVSLAWCLSQMAFCFITQRTSLDAFWRASTKTNASPSEVASADLSTGEIRTLVDVNPELQNLQINPAQRIDVFDKRGERFWGHLVLPLGYEAGKRYPLIITTYADYEGFLRGGVGDEYPIHVFAANGFAVLNFNDWALSAPSNPAISTVLFELAGPRRKPSKQQ